MPKIFDGTDTDHKIASEHRTEVLASFPTELHRICLSECVYIIQVNAYTKKLNRNEGLLGNTYKYSMFGTIE